MSVTTAEPLARTLPVLRLMPAPVSEPPYDDELPPRPASSAPPLGPLAALAPLLRLVPDLESDEEPVRVRTPASELPPAHPVARALVQGLLEALAAVRPLTQLQKGTSVELYAQLEQRLLSRQALDRSRPGRPATAGTRPVTGAVRSVHVQEQADGVAEVCATVRRGQRVEAVALRLEGIGGRWLCTDLTGL